MSDLLDVLPDTAVESVKVGNQFVTVHGLNARAMGSIVARFPHVGGLLRGIQLGPELIGQLGAAIGTIIAAGCQHLGDEKYEEAAEHFLIEDQVKLAAAVMRLTFPNGMGSFLKTVAEAFTGKGEERRFRMR